jgi:hypothetical protein
MIGDFVANVRYARCDIVVLPETKTAALWGGGMDRPGGRYGVGCGHMIAGASDGL